MNNAEAVDLTVRVKSIWFGFVQIEVDILYVFQDLA